MGREMSPVLTKVPSVCHLAASASGGAGIAAFRLHRALRAAGVESVFLSGSASDAELPQTRVIPHERPNLLSRVLVKFGVASGTWQRWQRQVAKLDCDSVFTSPYKGVSRLSGNPYLLSSELVHLHWVSGAIDWKTFFQFRPRKFVWTLHDMNPFLGIFHYEFDRNRAGDRSRHFDEVIRRQKVEWLRYVPTEHMTIVCPSRWLCQKSQASDVLSRFEHVVISNCVDTTTFRALPRDACRDIFQLPVHAKLILLAAENLNDPRKGLDLIVNGLSLDGGLRDCEVVVAGSGNFDIPGVRTHLVGPVRDARLMAILYNAVDFTIVPSREDNLPNVIVESLCCGTPVVCTAAGGMPELVCDPELGRVAADSTPEAVRVAALNAISAHFHRDKIAGLAAKRFSEAEIASQYTQVYRRLTDPSNVQGSYESCR
jgi:glycosyltransferase involved in cell wall biosynthesis